MVATTTTALVTTRRWGRTTRRYCQRSRPIMTSWTALDSVFPSGMEHIQDLLGLPTIMHNRQWSPKSDYIKQWTDIEWYISSKCAVPMDPVKFFDRFFSQQENWGLSMYEQDWMG